MESKATVLHYMPTNPNVCVLRPGFHFRFVGWVAVGLLLSFIAIVIAWAMVAVARDERKAAEQAPALNTPKAVG